MASVTRKRLSALVAASLLAFALSACGSGGTTSGSSAPAAGASTKSAATAATPTGSANGTHKTLRLTIGTGNSGGTYYYIGAAIASLVSKYNKDIQMTPQSTGGSAANDRLVDTGSVQLGLGAIPTDVAAVEGRKPFKKPLKNLRGMVGGYVQPVHIVVRADSGIKSIAGLQGKSVAMPPGAITFLYGQDILKDYKVSAKIDPMGYSNMVSALQNHQISAAFLGAGIPVSAVEQMATTFPIRILPVDKPQVVSELAKSVEALPTTIPANTYKGVGYPVKTVGFAATLVVNKSVPNWAVEAILKTIYSHHAQLVKTVKAAQGFSLKNAAVPHWIPLDPGAAAYLKQVGALKS